METTKKYLSCAETAKLLRPVLQAKFPGIKFSVRSRTYSGGASIDVGWTDGPTSEQIKAVCDLYEGATFDGMQDLKEYHDTLLTDEQGNTQRVHMGADYIFEHRQYSLGFSWVLHQNVDLRNPLPSLIEQGKAFIDKLRAYPFYNARARWSAEGNRFEIETDHAIEVGYVESMKESFEHQGYEVQISDDCKQLMICK